MKIGKKIVLVLVMIMIMTMAAAPQRPFVTCGFSWGYWYVCLTIVLGGTGEG